MLFSITLFLNYIQCPLLKNKHIAKPALVPTLRSIGGKAPTELGLTEYQFSITGPHYLVVLHYTKTTSKRAAYSVKLYISCGPYIKCCSITPGPPTA
jgi:hypothetical protein